MLVGVVTGAKVFFIFERYGIMGKSRKHCNEFDYVLHLLYVSMYQSGLIKLAQI